MRLTAAFLLAPLLAGCGGAYSANPASDEAQTGQDARLVGFWRVDVAASKDGPKGDVLLAVGRPKQARPGFEAVIVTLDGDDLDSMRVDLLPTKIGGKDYASAAFPRDESKPEPRRWSVLRYDLPDADTLRVLGMEEKTVAAEVRAGKISGSVDESKDEKPILTVVLDVSTTVLRGWLETKGDSVFRAEKPVVLKRVRLH